MKQCPQCKRDGRGPKPLDDFSVCRKNASGRQGLCRACVSTYNKVNAIVRREGNRRWRAKNGDKNRAYHRNWAKRNPLAMTAKSLRHEYGLTIEQYAAMFESQKGRCKICTAPIVSQLMNTREMPRTTVAHVDHCHETGCVRGLLCFNCNVGLGKFQDNDQVLLEAVRYLQATSLRRARETATEINRGCDETAQGEKRADESRDLVTSTSRGRRLQELSPFLTEEFFPCQ